jgi:Uma2 family endonuclease
VSSLTRTPRTRGHDSGGEEKLPPLESGDRLDQKTFHARYEALPRSIKAELIGGTVYVSSPLKGPHGQIHSELNHWVVEYVRFTPGTRSFDNATTILGPESEPQPDVCLLIRPACGGQTHEEDEYIVGAPELVLEVASSTESIDLHAKKADYERGGVLEYVVVALRQGQVFWFVRRAGVFQELPPGSDGIYRSEVFPGLWLDPVAVFQGDVNRQVEVNRAGVSTPEHAAFVARLAAQGQPGSP